MDDSVEGQKPHRHPCRQTARQGNRTSRDKTGQGKKQSHPNPTQPISQKKKRTLPSRTNQHCTGARSIQRQEATNQHPRYHKYKHFSHTLQYTLHVISGTPPHLLRTRSKADKTQHGTVRDDARATRIPFSHTYAPLGRKYSRRLNSDVDIERPKHFRPEVMYSRNSIVRITTVD